MEYLTKKVQIVGGLNIPNPDWEQNDPTAKDYIKNRTHYTESERKQILEETPLTNVMQIFPITGDILIPGQEYTIKCNNVEHKFTAYSIDMYGATVGIYLGDHIYAPTPVYGFSFIIDLQNLPEIRGQFAVTDQAIAMPFFGFTSEEQIATATIEVYGYVEEIKKLDNKYLDVDWIAKYDCTKNKSILLRSYYDFDDVVYEKDLEGQQIDDTLIYDRKQVIVKRVDADGNVVTNDTKIMHSYSTNYGDGSGGYTKSYYVGNLSLMLNEGVYNSGESYCIVFSVSVKDDGRQTGRIGHVYVESNTPYLYTNIYVDASGTTNPLSRDFLPENVAYTADISNVEGHIETLAADTIKHTEQNLSDSQKARARTNIGAISVDDAKALAIQPDMAQNDPTQPDYIKNRTHYEYIETGPYSITFDGQIGDRYHIDASHMQAGTYLVKLSDVTPSFDELDAAIFEYTFAGQAGTIECTGRVTEEDVGDGIMIRVAELDVTQMFVVPRDNCDLTNSLGVVFKEKGCYVIFVPAQMAGVQASLFFPSLERNAIKKLDAKYLEPQDWNNNDETSAGHIKNRPFYDGIVSYEPLFQEAPFSELFSSEDVIPVDNLMVSGETYTIKFGPYTKDFVAYAIYTDNIYRISTCIGDNLIDIQNGGEPVYGISIITLNAFGANILGSIVHDGAKFLKFFGITEQEIITLPFCVSKKTGGLKKLDNKFLNLDWIPKYINEKKDYLTDKITADTNDNGNNFIFTGSGEKIKEPIEGQTVMVDFTGADGNTTTYKCIVQKYGSNTIYIGDFTLLSFVNNPDKFPGWDNFEYPFLIVYYITDFGASGNIPRLASSPNSSAIVYELIKFDVPEAQERLPEAFLPKTIVTEDRVNELINAAISKISVVDNMTFELEG